jgi:hypothetical protein
MDVPVVGAPLSGGASTSELKNRSLGALGEPDDRPPAGAERGDGADPPLVEDLRESVGRAEVRDVRRHSETSAGPTREMDQVVADIRKVVCAKRKDARHRLKIERRRAAS